MKNKLSAVCTANLLNSEQIKILPKATGLFLIALSGIILFLSNSANAGLKKNIPHLPPDAPSSMYRNYLEVYEQLSPRRPVSSPNQTW